MKNAPLGTRYLKAITEIHFPSFPSTGGISIFTYTLEAVSAYRLLAMDFL